MEGIPVLTEEKKPEIRYDIPIQTRAEVELSCRGTEVTKAMLLTGNTVLSTIIPHYPENFSFDSDFYVLKFFGDVPYRGNLVNPENHPTVALFARDGVPSLAWCELPASVKCDKKEYVETVSVQYEDGVTIKKTIKYSPSGIVFVEDWEQDELRKN